MSLGSVAVASYPGSSPCCEAIGSCTLDYYTVSLVPMAQAVTTGRGMSAIRCTLLASTHCWLTPFTLHAVGSAHHSLCSCTLLAPHTIHSARCWLRTPFTLHAVGSHHPLCTLLAHTIHSARCWLTPTVRSSLKMKIQNVEATYIKPDLLGPMKVYSILLHFAKFHYLSQTPI